MIKHFLLYSIISLFYFSEVKSQSQFHYGMYMMHQPFFNPASSASYQHFTAAALYKTQWVGYNGAPKIAAFNALKPLGNSFVGLNIVNDQIGIDNNTEIAASYAYRLKLRGYSRLAFGASTAVNLLQSDLSGVDILDVNDPAYAGGKTSMIPQPNFKFGSYYYTDKFYLGFAIPNLLENKISLANTAKGETKFDFNTIHYYLHSGYRFRLNDQSSLNVSSLIKQVSGASLQVDFNAQYEYNRNIGFAVSYRSSKELLGIFSYQLIPEVKLAYAYEYNLGVIRNYSSGSHEVMLIYQFKPPKETVIAVPRF